jgi:lysine biosynthesis protein LysW
MASKKQIAYCPDCDATLRLKTVRLGQQITCRECGTILEIVELNPVELDWAFDEPYEEEEYEPRHNVRSHAYEYDDFPSAEEY